MFIINTLYIKVAMHKKRITQSELANMVGTNEATISLLLTNKQKNVNLELAYKICQVLELKINEFIAERIDPNKETTEEEVLTELYKGINRLQQLADLHKKIKNGDN